ncbi:germination protein, Ger(x)C family [Alkalihalophilus pseudofirmus OF4]|uniref:Germination protein, Ger(X)C family n=1 Tax=Alkalihalophilus pseudofirmus (strain ATCC BAA-2126 / JCM 17055 / OF4) TaxID=398511 RepID=D3FUJ0_ALKPO|nr:Ger(x)C family spore germination protein [Alkalihalophilus pseudofirmus]ADC50160.1 germination protein, Ger(x)C family [Alkalihalophilus pseudofirmus OF4]
MRKIVFTLCLCMILCGCLESKEIQSVSYAISMGVDFKDEQYELTLQFLDFSNVAKSEQGKGGEVPLWIAVGRGRSLDDAIREIYRTIQLPVNYEHLYNIVLSESVLERKTSETIDLLTENFLIPYSAWIYSTTQSMEEILASKVIFNYPFLYSRLSQPKDMQGQLSSVPPLSLQEFMLEYEEPTKTIMTPSINIDKSAIKEDLTGIPVPYFEGAHIVKDKKHLGYLSITDLEGYILTNNESERSLFDLKEEDMFLTVELNNPKYKIKQTSSADGTGFELAVTIPAVLRENSTELSMDEVKRKVETAIKAEISHSINKGRELGADIFQLEDYLYRRHHADWRSIQETSDTFEFEKIVVTLHPFNSINKTDFKFKNKSKE